MLMMRPAPCRRISGTTARVIRTIPKKFVSKIDPAGAPHHFLDGGFDRSIAGHVEGQHLEPPLLRGRRSPAGTEDPVASLGEPLRGGCSDARRCARNEDDLAVHDAFLPG